jgi:hypothetical protein
MTETFCGYDGDRDDALISCLYDDGGGAVERARFQAHLMTCVRCRDELAELRGMRSQLACWAPPEPALSLSSDNAQPSKSTIRTPHSGIAWWHRVPAWAQVAAALLFLGVSASIANLDVRYDAASGLRLRTGWMQASGGATSAGPAAATASTASPWKADLAALEQQLKSEMRSVQASAASARAVAAPDADRVRRVRALVDESEKRQQRELALRVAEVMRDVAAQRQADLVKIDRTLGLVQNNLGVEVMKDRQRLNLLYRASQRQ